MGIGYFSAMVLKECSQAVSYPFSSSDCGDVAVPVNTENTTEADMNGCERLWLLETLRLWDSMRMFSIE